MLMLMDIALIASVPATALCRNRVRQSARRLVALPPTSRAFDADTTERRSGQPSFRTICRKVASRNALDPAEADRLQDLAAALLEDLQPRLAKED
ncbi:hypothetical protein [Roseivivax sediminis]|nr:hypothetical protein [Roseivivax sediminis]